MSRWRLHLGPLLVGGALLVVCERFITVFGGQVRFGGDATAAARDLAYISRGEARFWLAAFLLAVPGCIALSYACERHLGPILRRTLHRMAGFGARERRAAGLLYFVLLFVVAQLGNGWLLLGHQITDDESGVRFGAQVWALGELMVPRLQPHGAWNDIYLYVRDGMIASMEWPGVIAAAALAEITGLSGTLYALLAAGTGLLVVATAQRVLGARGAAVAALAWLLSPMALSLSFTNHAHVVSRFWVALAFSLAARLVCPAPGENRRLRSGLALGLVVGIGAGTRPAEMATLALPLGALLAWLAVRQPAAHGRVFLACLVGLVPPLLAHALYNQQITGHPFLPPRLSDDVIGTTQSLDASPFVRLGFNLGFNLVMLSVWFFGPLGLVLAWLGRRHVPRLGPLLLASLVISLLVALLHDDVGIHTVGPMHYSEAAVPLTLLLSAGVVAVLAALPKHSLSLVTAASLLAGYSAGIAYFDLHHCRALRKQGEHLELPYAILRTHQVERGVVFAPTPAQLDAILQPRSVGSWQLRPPLPDPRLQGDLLFPMPGADLQDLRRVLPERDFYRLELTPAGAQVRKL